MQLEAPPEHNPKRLSPLEKPPELRDLLNQVAIEASGKWKKLGIQLKIDYHKLKTISKENHEDSFECYTEMFEKWRMCGNPPYTWATVIDALRTKLMSEEELARKVEHAVGYGQLNEKQLN